MKKVVLKSLSLSEWKAKNIVVSFNEGTTRINGENQIGKSSLIHAFTWLLTTRTEPTANANSEIFDNRVPLSPETPTASVTAIINIDGYDYELKRTAKAKFTRPRGSSEWVKAASDEYHTYIDNIEYNASDFNAWLSTNICKVEHLLYAIDGSFFTFLCEDDRTKARKVLESIVGDITIADFKGDFSVIADKLERLPIEHIEEQTKNEIKPLNKRLEEIPALIADKERTLAEYENIDYDFILSRIEQYKREIEAIDDKILGNATEFAPIIDKRNTILAKIAEVRTIIATKKAEYETAFKGVLEGVSSEINRVKAENERREARNKEAHRVFDTWKTRLLSLESEYKHLSEVRRPQLLKERDEIKARVFDGDTTCDYCGQELPQDMLEIAKTKFNEVKERQLNSVIAEGKRVRESMDNLETEINNLKLEIEKGVVVEDLIPISAMLTHYDTLRNEHKPYEETIEYENLLKEIARLESTLPEKPNNDAIELTNEKREIMKCLEDLNRQYGLKEKANSIRADIAKLNDERRDVACELAKLEGVLAKCKEYIEERANIISNRVNDKLSGCKIVMYSEQKDGTMRPDCVITDLLGVKYATLSNSARLRVNLQMSKLFRAHYDIELPYFVDEASIFSTASLPAFDTQCVYLYASDSKTIIVE